MFRKTKNSVSQAPTRRTCMIRFNSRKLWEIVDYKRSKENKTWKIVAYESGVPISTFSRLRKGRDPDVHNLVNILKYANFTDISSLTEVVK